MARIRTVKPEFWRHEDLSDLPAEAHLLAAALLNYCDDEGYFNANPKLIKAECCPLREDSVSIHDSITALSDIGYIRVGEGSDGKKYGQVVTFAEHQRINRPTASKIAKISICWEGSNTTHTQLSESSQPERKGKEGNRERKGTGKGREISSLRSDSSAGADLPAVQAVPDIPAFLDRRPDDTAAAFDAWNRMADANGLPQVQSRSDTRKRSLRARLKECGGLDGWLAALDIIPSCPFLLGENDRGWRMDIDYLLSPKGFAKIMEGSYRGQASKSPTMAALDRMRAEA